MSFPNKKQSTHNITCMKTPLGVSLWAQGKFQERSGHRKKRQCQQQEELGPVVLPIGKSSCNSSDGLKSFKPEKIQLEPWIQSRLPNPKHCCLSGEKIILSFCSIPLDWRVIYKNWSFKVEKKREKNAKNGKVHPKSEGSTTKISPFY